MQLLNNMMDGDQPKYKAILYPDIEWPIMDHLVESVLDFVDNPFAEHHKVEDTSMYRIDEQWPNRLIHNNIEALHNLMTVWCELKMDMDTRQLAALYPPRPSTVPPPRR